MVRVSTYYDKTEKEKFLVVRGDERYAHSTTTLLELLETREGDDGISLVFNVDVLRDKGSSQIALYHEEEIIGFVDWNSATKNKNLVLGEAIGNNDLKIGEPLNYDTPYEIYAVYLGNNQCQRSKSQTINVNVEDKQKFTTNITTSLGTQFDPTTTETVTINLSRLDESLEYVGDETISVYYDGELLTNVVTNDEGESSFDLNVGDTGKHTLSAVYNGNRNLTSKTITKDISVGYQINIIDYPSTMWSGSLETFNVTVRVTNFLNEPKITDSIRLIRMNESGTVIGSMYAEDDKGNRAFSNHTFKIQACKKLKAMCYINNELYDCETITIPNYYSLGSLSTTSFTAYNAIGRISTFTGKLQGAGAGVPVICTVTHEGTGKVIDTKTVNTSSDGTIDYSRECTGAGDLTFQMKRGGLASSIVRPHDYLEYYLASMNYNFNFNPQSLRNINIQNLTNGKKFTSSESIGFVSLTQGYDKYVLSFVVTSFTNSNDITLIVANSFDENNINTSGWNFSPISLNNGDIITYNSVTGELKQNSNVLQQNKGTLLIMLRNNASITINNYIVKIE